MARESTPRESLRRKLASLGIPWDAHEVRTLAGMLPVRLNGTRVEDLDADALAEALIYLIDKGIVRPPCRVEGLLGLEWGTHLCHFYRDQDDLLEFFTAYFRNGLESGEYCVWLAPDPATSEALRTALRRSTPECDESAIEFPDHEAWYLDENRRLKPADIVVAKWERKASEALQAGYRGLRCAAQVSRIDRANWSALAEYECEVNAAILGLNIKAVCAYPLLDCGARQTIDLRHSHQDLIVKGHRWWHSISATEASEANAVLTALQGARS